MSSDIEVEQSEGNSRSQQISVKCRAKRLFKLISTLNDAQRSAVKKIGFGGLLELKFKNFPISSLRFFLDCFSDGSYVFRAPNSKKFMLSKYDIHDCFLLPLGPNELDLVPTGQQKGSNSDENRELKERWRQSFRIESAKESIPLGKIKAAIEADREGGDDFCTLWVLMCMSSFLALTSNNGVDFKLLRAAENVNDLPKMDWCSYVIDSLVSAGVESKNNHTHILGCLPFLMISYFQRFDYRGQISVCELPLIKHWDEARLKSRTKGEIGNGGLRRQAWSFIKYPRCIHRSTNPQVNIFGDNLLPTSATPNLDGGKKVIPLEIPQDVEDDIELKARALVPVHELYLKIQRNSVAFHSWYVDAISRIKHITSDNAAPAGFEPSMSTQDFWHCEELHRFCDDVEKAAGRIKQSASNAPTPQEVQSWSRNHKGEDENATHQVREVLIGLQKSGLVGEEHDNASTGGDGKSSNKLPQRETLVQTDAEMVSMDTDVDLSKTDLKSAGASGSRTPQPATESEYANQGIEDVRLHDDNVLDDGLIGSGSFYNTAEINEVMLGDEKVSHIPLFEEELSKPTQGILRSDLEEAGYTASEVRATY
ncbi:hypothetical protein RND81_02G097400 [Saponaria officinalis]|uniref:Barwin domain-containing protein n=1 Tax=Saponaria officinalis TaxID=3572 RepID=A0AAW1MRJ3_SAPOF